MMCLTAAVVDIQAITLNTNSLKADFNSATPNCTSVNEMSVDTGDNSTFQSYPYRLPVN